MTPEQTSTAELVAKTALTVAASFFPSGTIVVGGVFAIYDALMSVRPKEVTEAEWRELLTSPALTKTADDYVNEARMAVETPRP